MAAEHEELPVFTIAETAARWFGAAEVLDHREEVAVRLAALLQCNPEEPDVTDALDRFARDGDPPYARNLVRLSLKTAYDEYKLARDPLTGLKTVTEHERWLSSTYGRIDANGSTEQRTPGWKRRSYLRLQIDFHNFKRVNDILGEDTIGDEVLRVGVAELLEALRAGDHISAYRTHGKGDEIGVAVSRVRKREAPRFWERLMRTQEGKKSDGRQQQLWAHIYDAIAQCPDQATYKQQVKAQTEIEIQPDGGQAERRILWIGNRRICNLRELAVLDIGYAFGIPESYSDILAIDQRAAIHRDQVKKATRRLTGGKYRNREEP